MLYRIMDELIPRRSPSGEDCQQIRLRVRKSFQVPALPDDPKTLEKVITLGAAALTEGLISKTHLREMKQKHEEEIAELQEQVEKLSMMLKESRDNSIKFFETTVQDKNNFIRELQENQKETNRIIAELSEARSKSPASFVQISGILEDIFPTALLDQHKEEENLFLEIDGIKIWVCISYSSIFEQDDNFHQAVTAVREKGAKAVLFLAPDKECRLIHGASKVYFEYVGQDTPVIYLRNGGCGNATVLQTCIMLLMKLVKKEDHPQIIDPDSISQKQTQRRSRLPKKSLEEIVEWLRENVDHSISADELCEKLGIGLRNVNDLGGIGAIKEIAYGIKVPKRGRARGSQVDTYATIMINEDETSERL